jgi:hypothetical protein
MATGVVRMSTSVQSSVPRARRASTLSLIGGVAGVLALALAIALLVWPHRASAPKLVAGYVQSFHNLTHDIPATGTIDGLRKDGSGAYTGIMTIKPPLYGTGPIRGQLDGRKLTYSSASGGEYTALLADNGRLSGTYKYGTGEFYGQKGTWSADPVGFHRGHTGLAYWLWFVVAGLAGVAGAAIARTRRSRRS